MNKAQLEVSVRSANAEDAADVIAVLHEAAAWMVAKGTPAWDTSRLDQAFVEPFITRSQLIVASYGPLIVGACTLSPNDPEFWPEAPDGLAAYLHKLAVRRAHAGRGVSLRLIAGCRDIARDWGCSKLRLDCHPNLRSLYERLGFSHFDTFYPRGDASYVVERLEVGV
ncbi:GNAT family N-acetyltransferase [Phenylobacterium sp.]|uniref:GNAT family N-acetyltransferase n=1 Tax=Phenylobacterium sp. TaxID=1871053 RepID=UPI002737F8A6|nr:GNAT family N-acetyltransferase [Phenylobacterium sp.]MDP3869087.1 GNAT family N-acetyltransferase [Phenylobacterium sp.]